MITRHLRFGLVEVLLALACFVSLGILISARSLQSVAINQSVANNRMQMQLPRPNGFCWRSYPYQLSSHKATATLSKSRSRTCRAHLKVSRRRPRTGRCGHLGSFARTVALSKLANTSIASTSPARESRSISYASCISKTAIRRDLIFIIINITTML